MKQSRVTIFFLRSYRIPAHLVVHKSAGHDKIDITTLNTHTHANTTPCSVLNDKPVLNFRGHNTADLPGFVRWPWYLGGDVMIARPSARVFASWTTFGGQISRRVARDGRRRHANAIPGRDCPVVTDLMWRTAQLRRAG